MYSFPIETWAVSKYLDTHTHTHKQFPTKCSPIRFTYMRNSIFYYRGTHTQILISLLLATIQIYFLEFIKINVWKNVLRFPAKSMIEVTMFGDGNVGDIISIGSKYFPATRIIFIKNLINQISGKLFCKKIINQKFRKICNAIL